MNKLQAKAKIGELVKKFEKVKNNRSEFIKYDEANTRKDFILPLFKALGWDVYNEHDYREVIEEETAITGRVDYSFRVNTISKFLLEAKALKIDLDRNEWAVQSVTYGWNKGITWVVLTDFEGLKLFNADWLTDQPHPNLEFTAEEYLTRFEDLWLLSKESIEKGELDNQASRWGIAAKRTGVSEKLAGDLVKWREELTKYFKPYNPTLSDGEVDEAVQKVLDRLIFIRVCEDRDIEEKILWTTMQKWLAKGKKPDNFMKELIPVFRSFDKTYNSGLFESHFCEEIDTEGTPFEVIINDLYGDKEKGLKYNFAAIPSDVLGAIYEQYLGYVQTKEAGESKRKKQGIYYTPTFIVYYIVENTLGPILNKCKTISDVKKIKVLDLACGSGSFLIKALDLIYRKYLDFGATEGEITKQLVLTENLFGVDLDEQAVELANLNLLINTLDKKQKLPSKTNIRVGNSLISGSEKELEKLFGKNFRNNKPFNWKEEFPQVFAQGGFDVVIGNPPYIKEDTNKNAFEGLHNNPYYQGKMDIWTLFASISIDLLKKDGMLGFIAPSSWISNMGASKFRNKILSEGEIQDFIDFGDYQVFENVSIQTMILIFKKGSSKDLYEISYLKIFDKLASNQRIRGALFNKSNRHTIYLRPEKLFDSFITFIDDDERAVFDKMQAKANYYLSNEEIGNGIDVLQDYVTEKHIQVLVDKKIKKGEGVFVVDDNLKFSLNLNKKESEYIKPYYTSSQINRYLSIKESNLNIIYADRYFREHIEEFPTLKAHLDRYKKILTSAFAPYGLHRARDEKFFKGKSIFLLRKTKLPAFTYVDFPCYVSRAFLVLHPNIDIDYQYLTGLLNSSLIYFWFTKKGKKQGEQLQIDIEPLLKVPLIKPDRNIQKNIGRLVDKITNLNNDLNSAHKGSNEWSLINSEIERIDKKIDEEVYRLYGLTPEEIKIVEAS